jgi:tetratricopeptide (TPR) repeat protein
VTTRDAIERGYYALSLRLADQARIDLQMAVDQMRRDGPFTARDNAAFRALLELYLSLGYRAEARLLFSRPDALPRLQELGYHQLGAQVAAAEGNYELALFHLDKLDVMLKEVSVERALEGLKTQTLGGQSEPTGSNLAGVAHLYEGFEILKLRANQLCQMGMLALEAGRPAEAAEYFRRAVTEVHADSSFGPWAGRYYLLIKGNRLVGQP